MEGPSIRTSPRMQFRDPIELQAEGKTRRIEKAQANLSVGGLWVKSEPLPLHTPVHVRIDASHPFEADGVVRFSDAEQGLGIQFVGLSKVNRKMLNQLIAELTRDGVPAA